MISNIFKPSKKHLEIFSVITANGYYKPTYSDQEPATQTLIKKGIVEWREDFRGVRFTEYGEDLYKKLQQQPIEEFKKFWVVSVNNYICDAAYSGKELKAKHRIPSFRQFHFIKSEDDLKYFTVREGISNKDLVTQCLNEK